MEEIKKETLNKTKRTKHDHVNQVILTYLQTRNYPNVLPQDITQDQFRLKLLSESESARPNSILYSCFNNEPLTIDHNFTKILTWSKEFHTIEVDKLIGALFCYLYLEILQRANEERAATFFKTHSSAVDSSKCDESIKELLNAITNNSTSLSHLKNEFRSQKYVINLNSKTVYSLKKFITESCHIIVLQILQNYFQINESDEVESIDSDTKMDDKVAINGHADVYSKKQKLMEAIAAVKKEANPIYSVHLGNVKDEASAGKINMRTGNVIYSYNSGIFVRSIRTLTQLDGMGEYNQEIVLRGHTGKIYDLDLVNNNLLVSASEDKTVRLFDLNDYSEKIVYKGHLYSVYCVKSSSNGFYIASGSYDHSARLWCTERNDTLRMFAGHSQEVTSIDFHPNSTYFTTGSADKTIRMWSINDGNPARLFLGSKGVIYALTHSSCGKFIASAGEDKMIRVWDLLSGKQLYEINTGNDVVTKLAWSTDKKFLAAGTIDGAIKLWEYETLCENPTENSLQTAVNCINLNHKLLSLDYNCHTFNCLTSHTQLSTH